MNRYRFAFALLTILWWQHHALARDSVSVDQFLRQQGWQRHDTHSLPRSPVADVIPLMFYDKGNTVPSCGLLTLSQSGKAPVFIELVGSEPGVGFPQCLNIAAMNVFRLQNKDYVAIDYLSRETREDVDRRFHYLVRRATGEFVTDKVLTDAAPVIPVREKGTAPRPAHAMDGRRFARITQLGMSQPAWRLLERDFISDDSSSFATFQDRKGQRCQFLTEAGGAPLITPSTVFAPGARCDSILASSRYATSGKVYYLAMFEIKDRRQRVAVTSVSPDGVIAAETRLADFINGNGATSSINAAKASLVNALQQAR